MCRTPLRLLSVSAVFLLAGCATTLHLSHETRPAYLSALRAEYLAENPDSPFHEQVARGLVVKGMDRVSVLASWGYPERRTRDGMIYEQWIYVDADESSGDVVEYSLAFRDGVVQEWQATRLTTGMTPVARESPSQTPATSKTSTARKTIPEN